AHGGGIYNSGTLTVDASTIGGKQGTCNDSTGRNSVLRGSGGGIYNAAGGTVIVRENTLIMRNNALKEAADIEAIDADGGGIYNAGSAQIMSSTISYNCAVRDGGGLANAGSSATLSNSTVTNNSAAGASFHSRGGGIYNASQLGVTA